MHFFALVSIVCLIAANLCVAAVPRNDVVLRTRNAPGTTDEVTRRALGNALKIARSQTDQDTYYFDTTSLAKSWSDATLFTTGDSLGVVAGSTETQVGIDIVCSTCYVNGSVSGQLTLEGNFNFTEAVDDAWAGVENVTESAFSTLENYAKTALDDVMSLEDIPSWPTLNVDFGLEDVEDLPDVQIHFEFDDLEIYLDTDIKLSTQSTYTINLFTTESPAGISIPDLSVGLLFSVDLILIADAEIDISTGIHLKVDKGLAFDFGLFDSTVSKTEVPGGSFEFLPTSIDGQGSIQAILSLQASFGVDMQEPAGVTELLSEVADVKLSAGIQGAVFAYLADFQLTVNDTAPVADDDCDLSAVAEYSLAVGAAAGATIAVDHYYWGPQAATTVPVWYTTLTSVCAMSKTSSTTAIPVTSTATASSVAAGAITPRANLHRRDDVSTTAVSTTEKFTLVACSDSGIVNCPENQQSTTSFTRTVTTDVTVQSGSTATYPANTYMTITSAIAFGTNVHRLDATSGSPTSYVPTASAGSSSSGGSGGTNNKLIIGLCVGLGAPALIAIIAIACYYLNKRRRYTAVDTQLDFMKNSPPTAYKGGMGTPSTTAVSPLVTPRDY